MPPAKKPNHRHQMLNLHKDLIIALKNRSALTNESMSSFVERILYDALGFEKRKDDYYKFFRWCIHHKRGTYRYAENRKFYKEELKFIIKHKVMKHPDKWSNNEKQIFKLMFRNSSFTTPEGDHPERIFNLPQLNKKNYMNAYNVKWDVENE